MRRLFVFFESLYDAINYQKLTIRILSNIIQYQIIYHESNLLKDQPSN